MGTHNASKWSVRKSSVKIARVEFKGRENGEDFEHSTEDKPQREGERQRQRQRICITSHCRVEGSRMALGALILRTEEPLVAETKLPLGVIQVAAAVQGGPVYLRPRCVFSCYCCCCFS